MSRQLPPGLRDRLPTATPQRTGGSYPCGRPRTSNRPYVPNGPQRRPYSNPTVPNPRPIPSKSVSDRGVQAAISNLNSFPSRGNNDSEAGPAGGSSSFGRGGGSSVGNFFGSGGSSGATSQPTVPRRPRSVPNRPSRFGTQSQVPLTQPGATQPRSQRGTRTRSGRTVKKTAKARATHPSRR